MVGKITATIWTAMFFFVAHPSQVLEGATPRVVQIGVIIPESNFNEAQTLNGFRDGLKELGYKEGTNLLLEVRDAKGDRLLLKPFANELVTKKVDMIFTTGTRATRTAMAATNKVPIIFRHPGDPVELRLVQTMDRPGANVTGVAALSLQSTRKRLEVFKEIVPNLRRVFVFYYANDRYSEGNFFAVEKAGAEVRVEVVDRSVKGVDELRNSIKQLQKREGDAIFHVPDDLIESEAKYIFDEAKKLALATMFHEEKWVAAGSLAAYGPNYYQMGRQAATLAQKILKGAKPKELAVQRANKFDLALNLRTASIIGLSVPQEIISKADKVIR
jgi:putative ABC transport system substrate-binding protein